MAEKDTLLKEKIKQSGIFDFKEFYAFIYDWLASENYDVNEKKYSEKVSGDTKEIEIEWEGKRKVSDYFQFIIKIEWRILGMKKIKVKKGDKEVNMDSGSVEIKLSCVLVKDYENKWEDYPLWKFLRGVYDKYIIKNRIDEYEEKLKEEFNDIISNCKSFLAVEAKR